LKAKKVTWERDDVGVTTKQGTSLEIAKIERRWERVLCRE